METIIKQKNEQESREREADIKYHLSLEWSYSVINK